MRSATSDGATRRTTSARTCSSLRWSATAGSVLPGVVVRRTGSYVRTLAAAPPAVATPQRQPHHHLRAVVALVGLVYAVAGVGDLPVGEAAPQPGHVDPLLRIAGRVDVGPAHRRAERVLPEEGIGAAGWIHPPPWRARAAGPGVPEIAQAVGDLGPAPHQPD